ncbi:MAG: protease inhibitor I42 family protein [Christensenellaceae bacterium]|jgi:inhibitor of cysteine peptidase
MKKRISTVLALLVLAVFLFAACGGSKSYTIELPGNPTTGYAWEYTAAPEGIVRETANDYAQAKGTEDTAGAGGTFSFTFEGANAGDTTLTFSYLRSWEEEGPVATVDISLSVDANGNIKETARTESGDMPG